MNQVSTENRLVRRLLRSQGNRTGKSLQQTGGTTVLVLFLMIVMFIMAVFAVDYGYLLVIRTDLQRSADNAALAAVQDLVPDSTGFQDEEKAKTTLRDYAGTNLGNGDFQCPILTSRLADMIGPQIFPCTKS